MEHYPVVIIGAGAAGLSCAYYLQKNNKPFLLLEASDGVGGRVRTDTVDGFLLDRGFQVFLTSYPEARKILDYEALQLKTFRSGALIRQGNKFIQLINPLKEPLSAVSSLFSPAATLPDKLKVLRLVTEVKSEEDEELFKLPATSTIDFLRSYGWSDKIIGNFFKPFFGGVFLERDLYTSSNFFKFVFKHFAQGDVALPLQGIGAIPQQLSSNLPPHTIRLHTKVRAISGNTIHLQEGKSVSADKIVLAVDKSASNHLLASGKTDFNDSKSAFNNTSCVYFAADRSPLNTNLLVINSSEKDLVNNLCVPSDIAPAYAPAGKALISVSIVKDHSYNEAELAEKVRQELVNWFGVKVREWQHLKTYQIPYALPAYPAHQNGKERIRINEYIYRCGDYTAYPSLNAAIQTGREVAEAIVNSNFA